jgi:hypothetical protein
MILEILLTSLCGPMLYVSCVLNGIHLLRLFNFVVCLLLLLFSPLNLRTINDNKHSNRIVSVQYR